MEDKPTPGGSGDKTFSWWDIQDENARLPVKESPQSELVKLFAPPKPKTDYDAATKAAKGAFKSLGKAMTAVAGEVSDNGPPVPVIAFKLLDLMKMHDDFSTKHGGKQGLSPTPAPVRSQPRKPARAPAPAPRQQQHQQQRQHSHSPAPPRQHQQAQPRQAQRSAQQDASLLDFGAGAPAPAANQTRRELHHATSSPAAFDQMNSRPPAPAPPANETRAERLKREYTDKQSTAQRVWDEVDQRWVTEDPKISNSSQGTANPNDGRQQKTVGIRLDVSSAAGKSASVQAAVNKRVSEMQQSQQKALGEMRQREEAKKKNDAEEDEVRKKLEPMIKEWSEEHGKKKQLRALLGTLQNILWAEANWKPVGLGDLLDDAKCKKAFHKASRVVHPDKTHQLDAEKRFLAKRIFDALSQAKKEFDEGKT